MPDHPLTRAVSKSRLHYPCQQDGHATVTVLVPNDPDIPPVQAEIDALLDTLAAIVRRQSPQEEKQQ